MKIVNLISLSIFFISAVGLSACAEKSAKIKKVVWKQNQQMILVLPIDWNANHGVLQRFQYRQGRWTAIGRSFNVSLGKNGSAWGIGMQPLNGHDPVKTEGDMRSPAGIFDVGYSFGYAPQLNISYPYRGLTKEDYCIDNGQSKYYNQVINSRQISFDPQRDSTEPMRRDLHLNGDLLYKLGFALKYNSQNIPKAGSCIFVHLRTDPNATTAGCTAMEEQNMQELLNWLNVRYHPVFVLLPVSVYHQQKKLWNLPSLNATLK